MGLNADLDKVKTKLGLNADLDKAMETLTMKELAKVLQQHNKRIIFLETCVTRLVNILGKKDIKYYMDGDNDETISN